MNRRAYAMSKIWNGLRTRRCRLRGFVLGHLLLDRCGTSVLLGKDVLIVRGDRIRVGSGVSISDRVWLNVEQYRDEEQPAIEIGDRSGVGRDGVISAAHLVSIGSHVTIAPRVLITDHHHAFDDTIRPIGVQGITPPQAVIIKDGVWIGANAVILPGVTIGKNAVVGANSVVTSDVPATAVVVGAPARQLHALAVQD